jgi:cysteine-rich repeat protein
MRPVVLMTALLIALFSFSASAATFRREVLETMAPEAASTGRKLGSRRTPTQRRVLKGLQPRCALAGTGNAPVVVAAIANGGAADSAGNHKHDADSVAVPQDEYDLFSGNALCGNGVVDARHDEECDDGNADNGDGCDDECQVEYFHVCDGAPSQCKIVDTIDRVDVVTAKRVVDYYMRKSLP